MRSAGLVPGGHIEGIEQMRQHSRSRVETNYGLPGRQPEARPQDSQSAEDGSERAVDPPVPNNVDPQNVDPQMEGVYIISVAARILEVHPQTLRKYEKLGLINPGRTLGMLRLYSREDIRRVRLIQYLSGRLGLNLAGVEFALGMVEKLLLLRDRLGAATQDTPAQVIIELELAALFESTGLPLDD